MARISLRAYNREIETLINRGRTQEAIDHCKHILNQIPKHLDTYRLLGKAYLESQRYAEAADVLERVLAALPSDFLAHLGMSIIREHEGSLELALWHMERAFEVQPANNAVQEELRRLYGRRVGVTPPKVRLTRGALVRMYARGDLHQQAIAEARAALIETPERTDLELILARSLFETGKSEEAIEVCNRVLDTLPYCFEANRLLADVLLSKSRTEEAQPYLANMHAMDPYTASLTHSTPSTRIPDDAVTVDHLDWQPSSDDLFHPDLDQRIGVLTKETDVAPGLDQRMESVPAAGTSIPEAIFENADLKLAGDAASSLAESSAPEEILTPSIEAEDEIELAPAEIPDWLKSLISVEDSTEETGVEEPENIETLETLLSSPLAQAGIDTTSPDEPERPGSVPEYFSPIDNRDPNALWRYEVESGAPVNVEAAAPLEADLQAWQKSLQDASTSSTGGEQSEETDLSEWLNSLVDFQELSGKPVLDVPTSPEPGEAPPTLPPARDFDESISTTIEVSPSALPDAENGVPLPDQWITELKVDTDTEQGISLSPPEESAESFPQSETDTLEPETEVEPQVDLIASNIGEPPFISGKTSVLLEEPAAEAGEQLPDWLQAEPAGTDTGAIPEEATSEWLNAVTPSQVETSTLPPAIPIPIPEEEIPEWLQDAETRSFSTEPRSAETLTDWFKTFAPSLDGGAPDVEISSPVGEAQPIIEPETQKQEKLPPWLEAQIDSGDIQPALDEYNRLIQSGELLDEVIKQLQQATTRYPSEVDLWQTLGDAYLGSQHIQEALDCYTRAEDLLS
ncbi:MAG: tetratricopeptide repeat protein [Anaerolineaceae bacterium]|nr:tetratricopeptide repeat protein [Anaerolineaceae bacterium]